MSTNIAIGMVKLIATVAIKEEVKKQPLKSEELILNQENYKHLTLMFN